MEVITNQIKHALTSIKPLFVNNWKYFTAFSVGSIVSLCFTFNFAYKLSGSENRKHFLFNIYMKYKMKKFSKSDKWRLSQYVPIRPSSELCFWDDFYYGFVKGGGDKAKQLIYINKPIKYRVEHFKQISCPKEGYDINATLLPFGANKNMINKYIKEIYINKFRSLKINYPGTEKDTKTKNIIIHFHGGSCMAGAPEMFRAYLVLLSKLTNATCYSIGYGLAPEYIAPVQVDHVISAYKYILNEYNGKFNSKLNKIFIGGHSAGGSLVLLALQKMVKENKIKRLPDGAIIISADVDRSLGGDTFISNKDRDCGGDKDIFIDLQHLSVGNVDINGIWKDKQKQINLKDPSLSPLYGNVNGLCDLYVHVGLNECLLSQNKEFVNKCLKNNVNVTYECNQWLPHMGPLLCNSIPESRDAVVRISEWIKQRM